MGCSAFEVYLNAAGEPTGISKPVSGNEKGVFKSVKILSPAAFCTSDDVYMAPGHRFYSFLGSRDFVQLGYSGLRTQIDMSEVLGLHIPTPWIAQSGAANEFVCTPK
jgi:hypothetical protein